MKTKIFLAGLIFCICFQSFGQFNQYKYKRELSGITDQWHKIILPDEIFSKISPSFCDIRIFGISGKNDTIEAPYILRIKEDKVLQKEAEFKLINQSKNSNGYYYTFELPSDNSVNQLNLEFVKQNFEWRVTLEGSQNLKEWFTITEDQRILSIKNDLTDFQFTKVVFPSSKYRYFRMLIKSAKDPQLTTAKISLAEIRKGEYKNYPPFLQKIETSQKDKHTVIDLDLKIPVPVCYLKICVGNKFDYYRPVTITYLSDSLKTLNGWNYHYIPLKSGILNSLEVNDFSFNSTILKKLKVTIDNQNNIPLVIDSVIVKGYVHEVLGRFTEQASYSLVYGNDKAKMPNYDINHFIETMPANMTTLSIGTEQSITKQSGTNPIFQSKIWLWIIMIMIIALLGWFSIGMIKKKG